MRKIMKATKRNTLGVLFIAVIIMGWSSQAVGVGTVTANLKKDMGVGVGFGDILETEQTLAIHLTAPGDWSIKWSKPRDNSGNHLWEPKDGIYVKAKTHTYTITGIVPQDGHAVGFYGQLTIEATVAGELPKFDAAVADLDIDLPNVEDDEEEKEPNGGLFLEVLYNNHPPADAFPATAPDNCVSLSVLLRPKWAGPPTNPPKLGNLTFTITGAGAAGVKIYKPDGTPLTGSVPIPPGGDYSATFKILTNNDFTGSATIKAEFAWDPSLASGSCTIAVDEVILRPVKIDLDICNGQGGVQAPETDQDGDGVEDEEDIGVFTAANFNNTNGDGYTDADSDGHVDAGDGDGYLDINDLQRPVTATLGRGRNEIDLMKVILRRPTHDYGGKVRLTIVSGDVLIWSDSIKTTRITDLEFPVSTFGPAATIEWYVEARGSTALQGIKLRYEYQPANTDTWPAKDNVSATGIWASATKVLTANLTALEVDAEMGADYVANGGNPRDRINTFNGTGVMPSGAPVNNVMLIEFTITPNNIISVPANYGNGNRARPYFDATRQVEGAVVHWAPGEAAPTFPMGDRHFAERSNLDNELPNDDPAGDFDESNEPTALGHMWQEDRPGGYGPALMVFRVNFREWLRVNTAGVDPTTAGDVVCGSRCSAKQRWYSKSTHGLVTTPNEISAGSITFVREALHTDGNDTQHGVRHHGVMRGLEIADANGAGAETTNLVLIDGDGTSDDVLDNVSGVPVVVKLATTLKGDQVAYTGVGYYGHRFNGEIVGPDGGSGETEIELAHEIDVAGAANPQSPSKTVTGMSFSLPAPAPIGMARGTITKVSISGARAEAEDNNGGTQNVTILIIDDDGASDDTLDTFTETVPKTMVDEVSGADVNAIANALVKPFNSTKGRIAARADGTVIGPDGSSGETVAEIAYEIGTTGSNPQSPYVTAAGPVYTMPAPVIGTNPIPIGGTSTVTMSSVYIEATGSTGNETFNVRVIDEDGLSDDVLQTIGVTIARPAGCFPDALIGPAAPVVGTLTNPLPGGDVKGPTGVSSGEKEAEIGYEIGGSDTNSPTESVTAS